MTNEAFCKVLCHNICEMIQSVYEPGIDPSFLTASSATAQKVDELPKKSINSR